MAPAQSIPGTLRLTITEKKTILQYVRKHPKESMRRVAEIFSVRFNKGGFFSLNFWLTGQRIILAMAL